MYVWGWTTTLTDAQLEGSMSQGTRNDIRKINLQEVGRLYVSAPKNKEKVKREGERKK